MQRNPYLIGLFAIAIVAIAALGLFLIQGPSFRNQVIDPPVPAVEISMASADGDLFRLSEQHGKVVLLFFGYTNCPNECPLTLVHIKRALELLGNSAQDIRVVMASTDPVRDTPKVLTNYLDTFNPTFIGLTGSLAELADLYQDYGVVVLEGGETHSSYTYVINRSGDLRLTFLPDTAPEDIAHDLKIVLAEK
jgi:protein SCO1/2